MKITAKKSLSFALSFAILIGTYSAASFSASATNSNENNTPQTVLIDDIEYFQISNAEDLYWFSEYVNSENETANAILTSDITINDGTFDTEGNFLPETQGSTVKEWIPIDTYQGIFDGQNYTINGLYYKNTDKSSYGGFILKTKESSVIKNLSLENSYIYADKMVGGICGYNSGTILNCTNNATVVGKNSSIGGISGYSTTTGEFKNCINNGTVSGNCYVGGICGENASNILNCYNTSAISGNNSVGGIYGRYIPCYYNTVVINCYNNGTISGSLYSIGGICGESIATIANCYNIGNIKINSSTYYTGGICGNLTYNNINGKNVIGTIYNCYSINNPIGRYDAKCTVTSTAQMNESAFHSGEVAYLLGQGKIVVNDVTYNDDVWGQNLKDAESYPELFCNPVIISDSDGTYINLHTESEPVIENLIQPTCTEEGSYEFAVYCSDCKTEMSRNKITVPATGHSYQPVSTIQPTCLKNGYTTYRCTSCKDTYVSDFVESLNHKFDNGTCTECNSLLETKHNYKNDIDESWIIKYPDADSISLTFSSLTETEENADFIIIYDKYNIEVGRYSGIELAQQTVTVTGDVVTIRIISDSQNNYYGFSLTDIQADYNIVLGDVDGNGVVSINDATLIQKHLSDIYDLDEIQLKAADTNQNGTVNIADATLIQKYIAGLLSSF